jgi:hypothetical protein
MNHHHQGVERPQAGDMAVVVELALALGFGRCSRSAMARSNLSTSACGSSFQSVKPTIDASLLQPCQDPQLAPLEGSDNELAAERLRIAKAYLVCKVRACRAR